MADLTDMRNIGKTMQHKLNAIGIRTTEELCAIGSEAAFSKMKAAFPNACLVHLYTLEGAIQGKEIKRLSVETKLRLKAFNEAQKHR